MVGNLPASSRSSYQNEMYSTGMQTELTSNLLYVYNCRHLKHCRKPSADLGSSASFSSQGVAPQYTIAKTMFFVLCASIRTGRQNVPCLNKSALGVVLGGFSDGSTSSHGNFIHTFQQEYTNQVRKQL